MPIRGLVKVATLGLLVPEVEVVVAGGAAFRRVGPNMPSSTRPEPSRTGSPVPDLLGPILPPGDEPLKGGVIVAPATRSSSLEVGIGVQTTPGVDVQVRTPRPLLRTVTGREPP